MRDIVVVVLLCVAFYAVAGVILWTLHKASLEPPRPRVERDAQGIRKDMPRDVKCAVTILQWTRDCKDADVRHRDDEQTEGQRRLP